MKLPVPEGYILYSGADISAVIDAESTLFYSCNARFPNNLFGQIVVKVIDGKASIVPIQYVTGRGQLLTNQLELYLIAWDNKEPQLIKINDFVPFSNRTIQTEPISVPKARWVAEPGVAYEINDDLLREKLRLSDTLLNAIRDVLIKNGLAK